MDDGEVDFMNQNVLTNPSTCSMDTFLDEIMNDNHACTHTHTCNLPGPDYSHTHTCFHMHTKIMPAKSEDKVGSDETGESTEKTSKKRSLGNREAVRKYREKKKARAACLDNEVVRLTALNQQLIKRLQGQGALEAEISRLKCLLVDIRGRIDGEIGSFPYKKSPAPPTMTSAYVMNPCNVECDDQVYCLRPGIETKNGEGVVTSNDQFRGCDFEDLQYIGNSDTVLKDLDDRELGYGMSPMKSSGAYKKRGGISEEACPTRAG